MPVVAPPPAPAPGPVLAADAAGGDAAAGAAAPDMAAAADWVPALAAPRHVQPAKLAVYAALVQQRLSVQQVAAQRRIQEDSVQVGGGGGLVGCAWGLRWQRWVVATVPQLQTTHALLPWFVGPCRATWRKL